MKFLSLKCAAIRAVAPLLLLAGVSSAQAADASAIGSKIDTGDNAWMLASTALVLMMTGPGLALFYGGLVRS